MFSLDGVTDTPEESETTTTTTRLFQSTTSDIMKDSTTSVYLTTTLDVIETTTTVETSKLKTVIDRYIMLMGAIFSSTFGSVGLLKGKEINYKELLILNFL